MYFQFRICVVGVKADEREKVNADILSANEALGQWDAPGFISQIDEGHSPSFDLTVTAFNNESAREAGYMVAGFLRGKGYDVQIWS